MQAPKCSRVWFDGDKTWVYKNMPKTMCDDAVYFLNKMSRHRYAPNVERVDTEVIRTRYVEPQVVQDSKAFMWHMPIVLHFLEEEGIRHGDLSIYSVIPNEDRPYLIDFAESRLACDPRPDKRPEGDAYWLEKTMLWYADGNLI